MTTGRERQEMKQTKGITNKDGFHIKDSTNVKRVGRKQKNVEKEEIFTDQQKLFCYEYIKDWNGTHAAIRAGYSETSAHAQSSRLLKHDKVKRFIDDLIKETLGDEIEATKLRVIRELQAIAFADITRDVNLVECKDKDGKSFMHVEFNETKDSYNKKAIASIKATSTGGIEVKYHDKTRALELLGRSVTLFTDKLEHTGQVINTNINYNDLSDEDAKKMFSDMINNVGKE